TFAALINKSLFRKTTGLDKLHLSLQSTNPLSPEMKETQAYKTYLGFAIGDTPPKKARKFKKPASPKLTIVLVSTEESTGKETPEMPLTKKREKVDVTLGCLDCSLVSGLRIFKTYDTEPLPAHEL
nr:hypothetical protein [Tanacetum cinerariifolium]